MQSKPRGSAGPAEWLQLLQVSSCMHAVVSFSVGLQAQGAKCAAAMLGIRWRPPCTLMCILPPCLKTCAILKSPYYEPYTILESTCLRCMACLYRYSLIYRGQPPALLYLVRLHCYLGKASTHLWENEQSCDTSTSLTPEAGSSWLDQQGCRVWRTSAVLYAHACAPQHPVH